MLRWYQKPKLLPEVEAEFELHGVDSVRLFLAAQDSFGGAGTARETIFKFGNASVSRSEVEDWLKWKDTTKTGWLRTGTVAAITAAVLAALAWLDPIR